MAGIGLVSALGPGSGSAAVMGGAAPGWWEVAGKTCLAAYQPKGAASLAASYINLANPGTYDASLGVAPAHNPATGWTFDGATEYLNTGLVHNSVQWSAIVRYAGVDAVQDNQTAFGSYSGTFKRFYVLWRPALPQSQWGHDSFLTDGGAFAASGVRGLANDDCYINGVFFGTIPTCITPTGLQTMIGAQQAPAGAQRFLNGTICALVFYSSALSGGEMLTVSTAMAAL